MKTHRGIEILLLTVVLLTACETEVDLCTTPHPHMAGLSVRYDWSAVDNASVPDSMVVLAERLVKRWDSCGVVPSLDRSAMEVKTGQYALMSFNRDEEEFLYEGLNAYLEDLSDTTSLDSVCVEYRAYQKSDSLLRLYTVAWTDYNPYTRYVQSSARPLLYHLIPTRQLEEGVETEVVFRPEPVMQHITLHFTIQKEMEDGQDFAVDSVLVELSGLPYKSYFIARGIDVSKTYKMLLEPVRYVGEKAQETDSYTNTRLTYSRSFHAWGVVPPFSTNVAQGPGILIAKVYLHSSEHPERQRPVTARINLYNTLTNDPLLETNEEGTSAVLIGNERTIDVEAVLRIDGETVLGGEEEGGADLWIVCEESLNVDI